MRDEFDPSPDTPPEKSLQGDGTASGLTHEQVKHFQQLWNTAYDRISKRVDALEARLEALEKR